jgi:Carboxypeptidase regulatory-like domain
MMVGLLPGSAAFAADPAGTIAGHFLDGTAPVPGALVQVTDANGAFGGQATTDARGAFTIADLTPGSYTVTFSLTGGYTQVAHERVAGSAGDPVAVSAGATTTVEETLLPHGRITGHVTNSDGSPAGGTTVFADAGGGGALFYSTVTDATGGYALPFVTPATYELSFTTADNLSQRAHQKTGDQDGDKFVITAGATTTVDEQLLATGAIAGHLGTGGQPVTFAQVSVFSADGSQSGSASVAPDGSYRIVQLPGIYQVQFRLPNGLVQWAHQKTTQAAADPITVAAGPDTIVDEAALPTGTLAGHLLGSTGQPVFGRVTITGEGQTMFANSFNGDWQAPVFPGTYQVSFSNDTGVQWAIGQPTRATAASFTVASGQTVRVDDQLAPTGSISLTARNSLTGQPVLSFCAAFSDVFNPVCTTTGTATFATLLPGTYVARISADGYLEARPPGVVVTSGQATAVSVDLVPGATISTTVTDALTGAPLSGVCVHAVPSTDPSSLATGEGTCDNDDGSVQVTGLAAGTYNLFVFAADGVHGDQWLGPHGGVGAQKKALSITVAAGRSATAPTIRVDRHGTLTGIIRDRMTGAPLPGAVAAFVTQAAGLGSSIGRVGTDATGRYTITELGPYDWPIFYQAAGYAPEWSGHTGNRLQANPVTIKAGKTRSHDEGLSRGLTLSGVFTTAGGAPAGPFPGRVNVVNADSFDLVDAADGDAAAHYTLHVLPRQNLALRIDAAVPGGKSDFFYIDSPDLAHATVVRIPRRGTTTVNIVVPPTG